MKATIKKYFFGWLDGEQPYESRVETFLCVLYLIILIIFASSFLNV